MGPKAGFRRTLKTGHVTAQGLDITLKNASPLQQAEVLPFSCSFFKTGIKDLEVYLLEPLGADLIYGSAELIMGDGTLFKGRKKT